MFLFLSYEQQSSSGLNNDLHPTHFPSALLYGLPTSLLESTTRCWTQPFNIPTTSLLTALTNMHTYIAGRAHARKFKAVPEGSRWPETTRRRLPPACSDSFCIIVHACRIKILFDIVAYGHAQKYRHVLMLIFCLSEADISFSPIHMKLKQYCP